ncbi:TetR/AcrR family transcriptional regulator, partial [Kibdelosporangium lantanae]
MVTSVSGSATERRAAAKRATIINAAATVFLAHGYGRSSVDAIAAEAGVGKQTVYNHFGDKERLFLAVIDHVRDHSWAEAGDFTMPDTGDPRADLTAFAEHELEVVLSPRLAALHRLTIAELVHHPELQRMWRDDGQRPGIDDDCVDYLRDCHERGVLDVADPELAVRQLSV